MTRTFIETPTFSKAISSLANDDLLKEIQSVILENPEEGDIVQGTSGIRKMRMKDPSRGKGKRGGLRVLYLDLADQSLVYLLYVYGKDEAEDLTPSEKKAFKELVSELKKK